MVVDINLSFHVDRYGFPVLCGRERFELQWNIWLLYKNENAVVHISSVDPTDIY